MASSIVWFRTDLRLNDNRALLAAIDRGEPVYPVFIWDPNRPTHNAANRLAFMIECIEELHTALGSHHSRLLIRHGDPLEELQRLIKQTGADQVFFGRHYEPYETARDHRVVSGLTKEGVECITQKDSVLFEAEEVRTKQGNPYTVFTPFKKAALEKLESTIAPLRTVTKLHSPKDLHDLHSDSLPVTVDKLQGQLAPERQRGGTKAAREQWDHFLKHGLQHYKASRDFPSQPGTSRMSPYLKFGAISIREIVLDLLEIRASEPRMREGADAYLNELLWREFYSSILQSFPRVANHAFQERFDKLEWEHSTAHFHAWKEGRTGVPIVDAAMRELKQTGWMHNRCRMIVASFLVKDLLINWQRGEEYFMEQLTDGDLAQNNGGWQWSASTGTDAQPFFRIFNPYLQSKKFDPEGEYIRKYVPELARVSNKFIHEPQAMLPLEQESLGLKIGRDYPFPIVDHDKQRKLALALYKKYT